MAYIVVEFELARNFEHIESSLSVLETRARAFKCSTPAFSGAKSAKIRSTGWFGSIGRG